MQAKECKVVTHASIPTNATERWKNILDTNDPKQLWQAIDWSGNYSRPAKSDNVPSDTDFAHYFTELLNPEDVRDVSCPYTNVYIPILDDPISVIVS
jgi:hypothetical protein